MPKRISFSIGVLLPRYGEEIERLFTEAGEQDASLIYVIGPSWSPGSFPSSKQRKERHDPRFHQFLTFEQFQADQLREGRELILIEPQAGGQDAVPFDQLYHPERAAYLLLGRDAVFTQEMRDTAYQIVSPPDDQLTAGALGTLVMQDRSHKLKS
jgi:hypothetical protein